MWVDIAGVGFFLELVEVLTGSGANGHNGGALDGNPLNAIADMIQPIVERFTGKPVDADTLQKVVAAAVEAERAKSGVPAKVTAEPDGEKPPGPEGTRADKRR